MDTHSFLWKQSFFSLCLTRIFPAKRERKCCFSCVRFTRCTRIYRFRYNRLKKFYWRNRRRRTNRIFPREHFIMKAVDECSHYTETSTLCSSMLVHALLGGIWIKNKKKSIRKKKEELRNESTDPKAAQEGNSNDTRGDWTADDKWDRIKKMKRGGKKFRCRTACRSLGNWFYSARNLIMRDHIERRKKGDWTERAVHGPDVTSRQTYSFRSFSAPVFWLKLNSFASRLLPLLRSKMVCNPGRTFTLLRPPSHTFLCMLER